MNDHDASRTAEFMALFRAIESARPAKYRLFTDIYARKFLSPSYKLVVQMSRIPIIGMSISFYIDHKWPGARTSGIGRTRFIDDMLSKALHEGGFGQIVILGAGYDSRAYRIPGNRKNAGF